MKTEISLKIPGREVTAEHMLSNNDWYLFPCIESSDSRTLGLTGLENMDIKQRSHVLALSSIEADQGIHSSHNIYNTVTHFTTYHFLWLLIWVCTVFSILSLWTHSVNLTRQSENVLC